MALYDFSAPRLFVDSDLAAGAEVGLDRAQANYLLNVLRLPNGGSVLVFNGRDGEWRAEIVGTGRKSAALIPREQTRPQPAAPDLDYLFAPLKHARLDYMVQKAVEMGAGRLGPVRTRRTVATRVNLDRMRANAIEAAEQCGILAVPEILPDEDLAPALARLEPERILVFCDEDAPLANPFEALAEAGGGLPCALLIGPEGGFAPEERQVLLARPNVVRLSLGPRILRADTAAVAALAVIQAAIGDWR
ncbi:16S rRNA (uracil(1498)-N(3))-methyltransferase [Enterovirga aerilata]|uniref:Ribosomal RNA small subunit methyltransferase E n=1 Tax=Enterovirga aerilata TaxID=2730920 RepID=A0A849I982_9HYPH|nr:16S rRNA (uracil(1498)-N(3))-methyltransferase [Enterovirga sp. DB1703]